MDLIASLALSDALARSLIASCSFQHLVNLEGASRLVPRYLPHRIQTAMNAQTLSYHYSEFGCANLPMALGCSRSC